MTDINIALEQIFQRMFHDKNLRIQREMTTADVEMWDSLTHMDLIFEVESVFGINFNFDEYNGFKNVGDMIDCISSKV